MNMAFCWANSFRIFPALSCSQISRLSPPSFAYSPGASGGRLLDLAEEPRGPCSCESGPRNRLAVSDRFPARPAENDCWPNPVENDYWSEFGGGICEPGKVEKFASEVGRGTGAGVPEDP